MKRCIQGLIYSPEFLSKNSQYSLIKNSFILNRKICNSQKNKQYISKNHNLSDKKKYNLITLEDTLDKKIIARHFENYGSLNHNLTYFKNNFNIPNFIHNQLIVKHNLTHHNVNFSFNVYKNNQTGFDWHKDIYSTGDITSITTILGIAEFQIRDLNDLSIYSFLCYPGSNIILSDYSRWNCEHRIISKSLNRISLVLGY